MFRSLTRGKDEKIQIRNIKKAEYPQKGCREMLIPSAAKTNCTQSGHIIAIRTSSPQYPTRIDSHWWHFNQSVARNSLHIPYLNLAKGKSGQTVTAFRMQGPQAGNLAETFMYKSDLDMIRYLSRVHTLDLFMVWSYSSPIAFSDMRISSGIDTRIINNGNKRDAMSKIIGYGHPELIHSQYSFRDMIFYNSLGGVKSGTTIKRPNSILCYSRFKHYRTTDFSREFTVFGLASTRTVHNLMDIHGAIQYAFTSTNENANAAWLLNQKTQYGRRTNPLQSI